MQCKPALLEVLLISHNIGAMVRLVALFTRLAIMAAGRKVPQFVLVQIIDRTCLAVLVLLLHIDTPHRPSMQAPSLMSLALQ